MRHAPGWVVAALALCVAFAAQALLPAGRVAAAPAASDSGAVPRRDIMDVFSAAIGREVKAESTMEPTPGISMTVFPSIGYNPSYGAFIGVSAALGGWSGDPANTTASKGSAGVSYSTTGQISVQFRSNLFTPHNEWSFAGDWRYLDTSQDTYGLGPALAGQTSYPMEFVLYRFYEVAYRRIKGTPYYTGPGILYDRYDSIRDERADLGESTPFTAYQGGYVKRTTSVGLSANVLVDSRDNPINATTGVFWATGLAFHMKEFGSDEDWQSLVTDLRLYPKVAGGTLGLWTQLALSFGHAPYLDLPAIGWDTYGRSGRGYLQGRIRSGDLIYQEIEYRRGLTADGLLGAVGFVNLTAATLPAGNFGKMNPGYGAGLRIKFNKRNATNLGVDVATSAHGGANLFFGLQEVF